MHVWEKEKANSFLLDCDLLSHWRWRHGQISSAQSVTSKERERENFHLKVIVVSLISVLGSPLILKCHLNFFIQTMAHMKQAHLSFYSLTGQLRLNSTQYGLVQLLPIFCLAGEASCYWRSIYFCNGLSKRMNTPHNHGTITRLSLE